MSIVRFALRAAIRSGCCGSSAPSSKKNNIFPMCAECVFVLVLSKCHEKTKRKYRERKKNEAREERRAKIMKKMRKQAAHTAKPIRCRRNTMEFSQIKYPNKTHSRRGCGASEAISHTRMRIAAMKTQFSRRENCELNANEFKRWRSERR